MGKVLVTLYVVTSLHPSEEDPGAEDGELTPTLPHLYLGSAVLVFGATVWEPSTLQPRILQNTAQLQEATPALSSVSADG